MSKFCMQCGIMLDDSASVCPQCNSPQQELPSSRSSGKKKKAGHYIVFFCIIIAILLCAVTGVLFGRKFLHQKDSLPTVSSFEDDFNEAISDIYGANFGLSHCERSDYNDGTAIAGLYGPDSEFLLMATSEGNEIKQIYTMIDLCELPEYQNSSPSDAALLYYTSILVTPVMLFNDEIQNNSDIDDFLRRLLNSDEGKTSNVRLLHQDGITYMFTVEDYRFSFDIVVDDSIN